MSRPLHIAFRADASTEIGTGHVMRCLTLADALAAQEHMCTFFCRELSGHLIDMVAARGHAVWLLAAPGRPLLDEPGGLAHAAWLGVRWQDDADEMAPLLAGGPPDWLVVDHYALDARWEAEVLPEGVRLMAIDDLADRPHRADLLLDQNLGRRPEDYDGLVPVGCRVLAGPRYALLRPHFAAQRAESLARRADAGLAHLVVSMGGIDKDDATSKVLEVLASCSLPATLQTTVVMGSRAPWLEEVRRRAATMHRATQVQVDVADMAALLRDADLVIGAAGGSAWERCCLGVPSLLLVLADNQAAGARALAAEGAALLLGELAGSEWRERLGAALSGLNEVGALTALTARAAEICDGEGAARVCAAIGTARLTIRRAIVDDARRIWEWRYAGDVARYYKSRDVPAYSGHLRWFENALDDPGRLLLIACRDGEPVAHVRLDRQPDDPATVLASIYVSPACRGQGIAGPSLRGALEYATRNGVFRFLAQVHHDNQASMKLFEACGFAQVGVDGDFLDYYLLRPEARKDGTC